MRYLLPLLFLFLCVSCDDDDSQSNLPAEDMMNVSYGPDPEQEMDIYLPANRGDNTKVIILVHGGAWYSGSRDAFNYFIPVLKAEFPDYAIVNMDYRLGTIASPGYPKQIEDIELLIDHLESGDYNISDDYAMIGTSAGGHLSLLYAYGHDEDHDVKAVASIVGPTDFTDPSYTDNPLYAQGLVYLVGNVSYDENPELYAEVSPRTHVDAQSPPTILFYGGQDPLVPATQSPRLKERLDEFNVYNEHYLYPNGGHGDWDAATMLDFQGKLIAFLHAKF